VPALQPDLRHFLEEHHMTPRISALALLPLAVAVPPLAANRTDRDCRGLVALTGLDHAVEPGFRVPA